MVTTIIIVSLLSGCILIGIYSWALLLCYRIYNISEFAFQEPVSWPCLSIIIPACNEEQTLASSMKSLLSIDYPNIEFILINDRSTDNTGKIIDELKEEDNRIRPIHIKVLPEGWLGKVYALDQGSRIAKGSWLLFTDADVLYEHKDVLKKSIVYSEINKVDHLTLIPWHRAKNSYLLELILLSLAIIGACIFKFPDNKNSKKSNGVGIGQFNLLRKSVFDKSKGLQWLRMEVLDDIGLSILMKNAGAKSQVLWGMNSLSFYWYADFSELAKGLEKNTYALFHYDVTKFLIVNIVFFTLITGPFLVFLLPYNLFYYWPAIVYLVLLFIGIKISGFFKRSRWASLFSPFIHLLFVYVLWRSAILFWVRGGIYWRGTFYSADLLRKNQRVKI